MQEKPSVKSVSTSLLVYVIWVVISISMLGIALLAHNTLVSAVFLFQLNPWQLRAIDLWSMVILGLISLVTIFIAEGYLRDAAHSHNFIKKLGKLIAIEAAVVVVILIIRAFI